MNIEERKESYKKELLPIIEEKAEETLAAFNKAVELEQDVEETGHLLWLLSDIRNKLEIYL